MPFIPPTVEELGLFLNLDEIDGDRGEFLINKAISLCQTVVKPLPEGADSVVLSVAGRAYLNPGQVTYETIGPMSVQRPSGSGGLYLTKADRSALKAAAGRGGAFSVDPTPEDANPWATWPLDDTLGLPQEYEPGWGPL